MADTFDGLPFGHLLSLLADVRQDRPVKEADRRALEAWRDARLGRSPSPSGAVAVDHEEARKIAESLADSSVRNVNPAWMTALSTAYLDAIHLLRHATTCPLKNIFTCAGCADIYHAIKG